MLSSSNVLVEICVGGGSLVIGSVFLFGARQIFQIGKNVKQVKDVVLGEPASLGIPARPGMVERVSAVETAQHESDVRVEGINTSVGELSRTVGELSKVVHEVKGAVMSNANPQTVILPQQENR